MCRTALVALAFVCILVLATASVAEKAPLPIRTADVPGRPVSAIPGAAREFARPGLAPAEADTAIYRLWTFDDGFGGADPQGWTTSDVTAQLDTFFHVDDFAGLGGGPYAPLSGTKSLWIGARPGTRPSICNYASLPGYGNGWNQVFESRAFSVSGSVIVSYLIRTDTEPDYDFVYLEYLSVTGKWRTRHSFTGTNARQLVRDTIPADSLGGSLTVRFRFTSDSGFSDEDGQYDSNGAAIIDSIGLGDAGGGFDFQGFEGEAVGARATADGDWHAGILSPYGDYAGLLDGSTVLQQDPLVTNTTHFWGFLSGSTASYGCAGHPEQVAVPYPRSLPDLPPGELRYLDNKIVSPVVPVPTGIGVDTALVLQFDVYRDMSQNASVFYAFYVRSRSAGECWPRWRSSNSVYYGAQKDWYRFSMDIGRYLEAGATEFQVAIAALDVGWLYGTDTCHSHAPLVDNVRILKIGGPDEFVVTNTDANGAGSFHQAIHDANELSTKSLISFDIPGPGPYIIDCSGTTLPWISAPVVIDGTTQPGYAGAPVVTVYKGEPYVTGGDSEIRGIKIQTTPAVGGLHFMSDRNRVHGTIIEGGTYGVYIDGSDNVVGGVGPGEGNEIRGNSTGVLVYSGTGNTIRGNNIHDNTNLGIDLYPLGVNENDAGDADTGPNGLLNYPGFEYVLTGSPGGVGGYVTGSVYETQTLDFYASPACGQGMIYLGSTAVGVVPGVTCRFHATFPSIPLGYQVTATSTDRQGNTSELSACQSGIAGQVFIVTNTNDSGAGSLREAVSFAIGASGMGLVAFDIPGAGPHRITLLTNLPAINHPIVIDGFSQPGSSPNTNPMGEPDNAVIKIEIAGIQSVLRITTGQTLIRGLSLGGGTRGISIETTMSQSNRIEGCNIGIDAAGTGSFSNTTGIYSNCPYTTIGGTNPGARNIISGNTGTGVSISGTASRVVGNLIGVQADGALGLGNGGAGVAIGGTQCVIGGETAAEGNVIAFNGGAGVAVTNIASYVRNSIVGNSIFSSGGLGIDLGNNGVTANDAGDPDNGPNALQNFPVPTSAVASTTSVSVVGTLNSIASSTFRIHCYANLTPDASGYGEGRRYLGAGDAATDGSGNASFGFTVPKTAPPGWYLAMTATDSQGNTSEFSTGVQIVNTPAGSGVATAPIDTLTGEAPATITFASVTVPGITSLSMSPTGPLPPSGWTMGNSIYYAISTTATFSGNIEVCISYDESTLVVPEGDLRLLHWDTSVEPAQWVDVTTSLNTTTNTICGVTTSLSPFAIGVGPTSGSLAMPAPGRFALRQNVPNPFNPVTTVSYDVPARGARVMIAVYDVTGRRVRVLVNGRAEAGTHTVRWDGRNERGDRVATGIYFCRMQAEAFAQTRKMVLLR